MKQILTTIICMMIGQMAFAGGVLNPDTDFSVSYHNGVIYAMVLTDDCNGYGYNARVALPCVPSEPGGIACLAVNSIGLDFHTQTEMYCEEQSYKTYAFDVSQYLDSLRTLGSIDVYLVGHGKSETIYINQ